MMIKKFYGASLAWLLVYMLFCPAPQALAQGGKASRDHLTPEEVELVRAAQVLDVRTAVFIKAAERRLMALTDTDAASSRQVEKDMKKWGELPTGTRTQLLTDLAKILGEATTNIDDVAARDLKNELLPKALDKLASASTRFLSQLKPMRTQAQGAEREALEQAIENAQTIVEAADRLLPEAKGKEKSKN
ncbi:MAG: hypothetical protein WCF57_11205 [Pyrinomonadaceae bacterium]